VDRRRTVENREFLMLAHTFNPSKHSAIGMLASEKLDGVRAFWDGGVSRGMIASDVPWANTHKDKKEHIATGLWSRKGKVIHAPRGWLDLLPKMPLDGELWMGRGMFQETCSAVRKESPNNADWEMIQYKVFDSPSPLEVFRAGKIYLGKDEPYWIIPENADTFWLDNSDGHNFFVGGDIYLRLTTIIQKCPPECILMQRLIDLPYQLNDRMTEVLEKGGEGVVLRKLLSSWEPKRSYSMLKVKDIKDDEAVVIGHTLGEGRLAGKIGALVVRWKDKVFELAGLTDIERELNEHHTPVYFPTGTTVTFKYRELTRDGIPKEARYWRIRRDNLS
jgi:DNA ligase-1